MCFLYFLALGLPVASAGMPSATMTAFSPHSALRPYS